MEKTEKIKVHGHSSGKLYITPFDLFSLKKVQELIKEIANKKQRRKQQKRCLISYWEERQLAKDFAAQELADYKARLKEEFNKFRNGNHVVGIDYLIELIDKL